MSEWTDFNEEKPLYTDVFRVKNQYGQTAQSYWNGHEWGPLRNHTGSCFLYSDAQITHWDILINKVRW